MPKKKNTLKVECVELAKGRQTVTLETDFKPVTLSALAVVAMSIIQSTDRKMGENG